MTENGRDGPSCLASSSCALGFSCLARRPDRLGESGSCVDLRSAQGSLEPAKVARGSPPTDRIDQASAAE